MLTPEQIELQLKNTADAIEKGVADINAKKASKQEVLDLIADRTKGDKELLTKAQADITQVNTGVAEVSKTIGDLKDQIKLLRGTKAALADNGSYREKGNFASPQEAKTFALLVMAATMAGEPACKARYDNVKSQLDALGIDPYFVDAGGRSVKAMTGSSQTGGGALVTVEQIPSIITLLEQYGLFRANALGMPMGAGQTIIPKIDGLLTMYCPGEGGAVTQTAPTIATIALTPKTLCGLTAYSMELEDDSLVALGELLAGLFARSCAYYEDLCGFLGDGTSTYFGFKGIVGALRAVSATIASIKSLVVGSGNAYSELVIGDFEKVPGTLPDYADDGDAAWYVHRYFYWTNMVRLALASGVAAQEVLLGAAVRQKTFFGYPVKFSQVMPKAEGNSQICALLANLRQGAYLGTRGGIEIAQSSERYFDQGLIAVLCRDRVAINVHGVGDTTNAGPICGLITAAS